MCGIVGFIGAKPGALNEALLKKMNDCIVHRGPDDAGVRLDGSAGLGMRRLSIIDLAAGHQPMTNEDESLWIVFNGEIYNFQSLREELLAKGHPFKTHSDTEVILHLYEEMGPECVTRLRGMFAFALHDKKRDRLLLARDRLGKKPLVYTQKNGTLAWASELRSLLELPGISKEVDLEALDLYLSLQYIPSPRTIFKDIRKLPPAHILIYEKGQAAVRRYWDLPVDQPTLDISLDEAKHTLREKLTEAVRLRMIADVPLGAFLSGGVDSTLVVGLMSGLTDRPVKTFAVGFEEQEFSELPYARAAADRFGTQHTEIIVKPEMTEVLPKLAWHYGEPFGDSSSLPTYYVAKETRRYVTVALNGDGGDEIFAGYPRYAGFHAARYADAVPRALRPALVGAINALPGFLPPKGFIEKSKRFANAFLFQDDPARYRRLVGHFSEADKDGFYAPALRAALPGNLADNYLAGLFDKVHHQDDINRLSYVDLSSYLPECLMTKVDIATMANSLEGRSPLLDHEVAEWVYRLPGAWKWKSPKRTKWIFKETLKDLLPPSIQTRKKMGFGIPVDDWFRGKLKDYWAGHVLSQKALARGYFRPEGLRRIFDEHIQRRRDHGYRLWTLLMLELWHEAYLPDGKIS